jgi:hypothetical protein
MSRFFYGVGCMLDKDWNRDRIITALAQMHGVHNDMMSILDRGYASENMRNRMVAFLRNAADDLEKIKCK